MSVTKELFGKTRDGKEVYCYSIENKNKMCAKVITFGAILKNLYVPDKKGKLDDVVLGYDKLWMYFKNGSLTMIVQLRFGVFLKTGHLKLLFQQSASIISFISCENIREKKMRNVPWRFWMPISL